MEIISESITELFHHLLKGETGDEGKQVTEGKAEAWPARMLAAIAKRLQHFI